MHALRFRSGSPSKPRVLHALEAFAGGTERHLLDLVEHVADVEHVIVVPSMHLGRPTQQATERAQELGAIVEIAEMGRSPAPHRSAAAINCMRALIRRYRPAVVHGHSSVGGAVSRLAATGSGVPVVYTPNGISRLPWAVTLERSLRRRTDWLIAVSEGEREFAVRKRLVSADRVAVIRNGIDLTPPPPPVRSLRQRLGVPEHALLVGCLGRLTWQKAPEVYVTACAIAVRDHPHAHFVLIGAGPHAARVQANLRVAGLGDRFHWLSELPGAASAFSELDLYVLPSRFEGGPYTPLEAMRARTPVIVSDVAGNRDTVEDGVTGVVVPVEDPIELGRAMIELLEDPERRAALATAAAQRLEALFDVREMGVRTSRIYQVIASHSQRAAKPARRLIIRTPVSATPQLSELPGSRADVAAETV